MAEMKRRQITRGFTLIELLVVVAIIAVLVSILMPSLGMARMQAKTVQCGSHLRTIGLAMTGFSMENDGRLPGSAVMTGSVAWYRILNAEYFGKTVYSADYNNTMIQPMSGSMGSNFGKPLGSYPKAIFCPLFEPDKVNYPRCYMMNSDANGGETGLYALPLTLEAAKMRDNGYVSYSLGAKMSMFNNDQFLVTETHRNRDTVKAVTPYGVLAADVAPMGSYGSGFFMFRHSKDGRMANALFFDGRVEVLTPKSECNTRRRLSLGY